MKIFLSSVIRGFDAYRNAAARAARALRHEVKRAEDFPASSATPQQACLAGVRWAEAVILLLGGRYGDRQASGISPTHEEYREARERCLVLIFAERGVEYGRAQTLLPALRNHAEGVTLTLVVAGGPRQQVLRPRELEARALEEDLSREALFGAFRVLDRTAGTMAAIRENALVIEQEKASILVDQLGSVRLVLPAERPRARGDLASAFTSVAIREDIEELLQRALGFVAWVLDRIDPKRRISDVVPVVNLSGALGWRTRVEHERSPNSFTMRTSQEPATVSLTPARRHRAALSQDAQAIAEDLATLLERKLRP